MNNIDQVFVVWGVGASDTLCTSESIDREDFLALTEQNQASVQKCLAHPVGGWAVVATSTPEQLDTDPSVIGYVRWT